MKFDNEEEYYRALCILFLPFRDENKDIHSCNVKDLYFDNQDEIEGNRSRFEKHKTLIDAIEEVENRENEEELDDI